MKRYYIEYYRDFSNTCLLYWAESDEQIRIAESKGYKRITRKQAEKICTRKDIFTSNVIFPVDYEYRGFWMNDNRVYKNRYTIVYN